MTWRLRWSERSVKMLETAAAYLNEVRSGSGHAFLDETERTLTYLEQRPRMFPQVPDVRGEVRRALVRPYGYWVIYDVVEPDTVTVLSVWHSRRAPDGWRQRKQ